MPSMSSRVLNDDVILDHILPNLDLKDILAVRQVSDQMRQCSNQPAVWKRILANTEHRLPPLPPTARYSLANLSRFEAERLYTRSVSLPTQWDQDQPRCVRRWEIDAQRKVLEMALLPGGQYLVASVRDRNPTRHSIEVFASDFQYSMGFPFARFATPTKAFNLRVKYLTFQGQPGIVIAYIRRDYRREKFKSEFDVNRIMPDSDWFSSKVKYECVVLHVPLKSLEHLFNNDVPWDCREYRTRARQQPRPFQVLTEITSRARMSVPVIDEDRNGTPFVAVLKHPDRIVYKNLDGGLGCTMYCEPHPTYDQLPHAIMAFTFLRSQHQFLLVRRAGDDPDVLDPAATAEHLAELAPDEDPSGPYYFAELYNVDALCAPGTSSTRVAAQWTAVHDAGWNFWKHVWITDPSAGLALRTDASVQGTRPQGPAKPPPITIFVQAVRSYGLVFNTFFPEPVPAALHGTVDGQTEEGHGYTFVLSPDDAFIETDPLPEGVESLNDVYEHRVLLGATRPVIYTIPREGSRAHSFKIQMLGGVWDEGLLDRPLPVPSVSGEIQEEAGAQEDGVDGEGEDGGGEVGDDVEDGDAAMGDGVGDDDGEDEMGSDEVIPQGDGDGDDEEPESEDGTEDEDGMSDVFEDSSRIRVSHQFDVALEDLGDVSAIAWDETIGRLCIGYAGNSKIAVFDFAGAPVPVDTHA